MKYKYLTIVVGLVILMVVRVAFSQENESSRKDLNFYFGNGMLNDYQGAILGAAAAWNMVKDEFQRDEEVLQRLDVKLSFNQSEFVHGKVFGFLTGAAGALVEADQVLRQKLIADSRSDFLRGMAGEGYAPEWLEEYAKRKFQEDAEYLRVRDDALRLHTREYQQRIDEGECVVVMAHSQGSVHITCKKFSLVSDVQWNRLQWRWL